MSILDRQIKKYAKDIFPIVLKMLEDDPELMAPLIKQTMKENVELIAKREGSEITVGFAYDGETIDQTVIDIS